MRITRNKGKVEPRLRTATMRITKQKTADLYEWVDQVINSYGEAMESARKSGDDFEANFFLDEAKLAASIALEIATEVQARQLRSA